MTPEDEATISVRTYVDRRIEDMRHDLQGQIKGLREDIADNNRSCANGQAELSKQLVALNTSVIKLQTSKEVRDGQLGLGWKILIGLGVFTGVIGTLYDVASRAIH